MRLTDVTYAAGRMEYRSRHATEPESALPGYLDEARRIIAAAEVDPLPAVVDPPLSPEFEALRWFPLPGEIAAERRQRTN
jgi:hypothetical protein